MAEEMLLQLIKKYGEDFNWMLVPSTNNTLVDELNKELGSNQFGKQIYAVAKCESNDDVLFYIKDDDYRIYHLTYSSRYEGQFLRFKVFDGVQAALQYIEQDYIENYL